MLPKELISFPKGEKLHCFGTPVWSPWLTQISPHLKLREKRGEQLNVPSSCSPAYFVHVYVVTKLGLKTITLTHIKQVIRNHFPKSHQIMIINLCLCTSFKPKLLEIRCLQLSLRSKSQQEDILTMTRDTLLVCLTVMIIRSLTQKYLLTKRYYLSKSLF